MYTVNWIRESHLENYHFLVFNMKKHQTHINNKVENKCRFSKFFMFWNSFWLGEFRLFLENFWHFLHLQQKGNFFIFYFQINIFRLVYCDNDILFFIAVVRRKTIYEYHRVNMKDQKIANNTAIRLKALPRCNMKRSCKECLALTVTENDKEVPVNK